MLQYKVFLLLCSVKCLCELCWKVGIVQISLCCNKFAHFSVLRTDPIALISVYFRAHKLIRYRSGVKYETSRKRWSPRFYSGSFFTSMGGLWGGKCDVSVRFNYILQGNQNEPHARQRYSRDGWRRWGERWVFKVSSRINITPRSYFSVNKFVLTL